MFPFLLPKAVNWNAFGIPQSHVNSRNKCSDLPPAEPRVVVDLQLPTAPFCVRWAVLHLEECYISLSIMMFRGQLLPRLFLFFSYNL